MEKPSFAFITPSYAPDFERCKLLCWSIKKFVVHPVQHYIIVDRKDFGLFQSLENTHTKILIKEEILPSWIKRFPVFDRKNIWLNLKGYQSGHWLIRGWLTQQIIKLAAAEYVEQEILVFIDSDVAFINSFNASSLFKSEENKVRLFRVEHDENVEPPIALKWKENSKKLLSLPQENNYYDLYIDQVVTWRRSNLIKLYQSLEEKFQRNWLEVIAGVKDISEYILYGIFSTHILGERSGHYDDHRQKICWSHWEDKPMAPEELKTFFKDAYSSGHRAVMISAKSSMNISIEQFEGLLNSVRS